MIRTAMMSAALLAIAMTGQAHAQAAVEDPGYCAQFYPNANCQDYGPGNPMTRRAYGEYTAPVRRPYGYAVEPRVRHHHRHTHHD